jgi:hypothetical protein
MYLPILRKFIMRTILNTELMPTIMAVAESSHYLVGAVDSSNNFISLNQERDIVVLNSLVDAKEYLRSHNIFTATLEFQTAYDEMCGTETVETCRQIINL